MKIWWFGHSCFGIEDEGVFVVNDPFDKSVGYPIPNVKPTHVTESHQHFDHNAHNLLRGNFKLIKDSGKYEDGKLLIEGIPSFHDEVNGEKRGPNIIFKMTFPSSITVVHFGDLGHLLDEQTMKKLKGTEILMIPVGGIFTIDAKNAKSIVDAINPHVVFPMHYMTPHVKFDLGKVEEFTAGFEDVKKMKNPFEIDQNTLKTLKKQIIIIEI
jgi:L-ascorbate metabolism protein UlaG (beta-lactamase superfamily)